MLAHTPKIIRALRWIRLTIHILHAFVMVGLFYPRVSAQRRARLTQSWSAGLLRILAIKASVVGQVPSAGANKVVIVANHVSWLDIFLINAYAPASFVAKSEIRDWPLAGWLVERAGAIFIRRTQRSDTKRINQEIHDSLETGLTIAIFPEGTTTIGDRLLKFHSSLFEPAILNSAMVYPVAVSYRRRDRSACIEATYAGDISFSESIKQIIASPSIAATLDFAPVIAAQDLSRRELAARCELAVAARLGVAAPDTHQRF